MNKANKIEITKIHHEKTGKEGTRLKFIQHRSIVVVDCFDDEPFVVQDQTNGNRNSKYNILSLSSVLDHCSMVLKKSRNFL